MKPNNEKTSSNDSMEERNQPQSSSSEQEDDRDSYIINIKPILHPYEYFRDYRFSKDGLKIREREYRIRNSNYGKVYFGHELDKLDECDPRTPLHLLNYFNRYEKEFLHGDRIYIVTGINIWEIGRGCNYNYYYNAYPKIMDLVNQIYHIVNLCKQ